MAQRTMRTRFLLSPTRVKYILRPKPLYNCANTCALEILESRCCLYTVTNGDSRLVVMVEIARADKGGVALRQIKGYCNGPAPKDIERIVRRWFNRNKSTVRIPRSAAV